MTGKTGIERIHETMNHFYKSKYAFIAFGVIIALILLIRFFPVAFQGYVPQAQDTQQWRYTAQPMIEYNETHKDNALWDPNIFSGMPGYLIHLPAKFPFIDNLKDLFGYVINWRVLMMISGGIGVYLLLIMLGFEPIVAFSGGIAFALSCHFPGLLDIGHNTKFRAAMYIPWVFLTLEYMRRNRSVLSIGLLMLMLIGQLRENHPQIVYYTMMMIGIYWIMYLIWSIRDKKFMPFLVFSIMLLLALIVSVSAVTNPYLSTREYADYSIRGKEGLSTDYAQGWSFHPAEMITFFIPKFFGGISPYYWGWMPSTQTSFYMGTIILILAIIAVAIRRDRLTWLMIVVSIVALLVSFGRHFGLLSELLLKYLPYFNKFRVPAMIMVLVEFCIVVLAAQGIRVVLDMREKDSKRFRKNILRALIAVAALMIVFFLMRGAFAKMNLASAYEMQNYTDDQLNGIRQTRLDMLMSSGLTSFLFAIVFLGATWLLLAKKVGKYSFLWLVAILVVMDMLIANADFMQKKSKDNPNGLITKTKTVQKMDKTAADEFLLKDNEVFRIYPLGSGFSDNRWTAHHQSIGGYHPSKLSRYRDIIEECLNVEIRSGVPINWHIVNMLNTKYLLFNRPLPLDNLEYAFNDQKNKMIVYKNKEYLPRAWFADSLEVISDPRQIIQRLNDPNWDPAHNAIVESPVTGMEKPDSASVTITDYQLQSMTMEVKTEKPAYLVISEIYYPAGWKAWIDGQSVEIHPTDYILRGIEVPAGSHTIEMKFDPEVYHISKTISLIGLLVATAVTLLGAFLLYRRIYGGKTEFVLKDES